MGSLCFGIVVGAALLLLALLAAGYFGARQAGVGCQDVGRVLHTVAQWLMQQKTPPAIPLPTKASRDVPGETDAPARPNLLDPGTGNHRAGEALPPGGPRREQHRP